MIGPFGEALVKLERIGVGNLANALDVGAISSWAVQPLCANQ